jgi:hypothetical protein
MPQADFTDELQPMLSVGLPVTGTRFRREIDPAARYRPTLKS